MNFREHQQMVRDGDITPLRGSCRRCSGWGYTEEEGPHFRKGKTVSKGSGCPRCLGDGVDPEWAMTMGEVKPNLECCDFST